MPPPLRPDIVVYVDVPVAHVDAVVLGIGLTISAALGLAYGLVLTRQDPGPVRTAVKVGSVLCLLVVACFARPLSPALIAGLGLCALGDGFLAGARRWLPLGLAAFLAGHIAYCALFFGWFFQFGLLLAGDIAWLPLAALVPLVLGVGMLAWLWRDLGGLRWAVAGYVLAIVAMVESSLPFSGRMWLTPLGAAMFMASDTLLSVQLFKPQARWAQSRAAGMAIWFLYLGGQWAITAPFLGVVAR